MRWASKITPERKQYLVSKANSGSASAKKALLEIVSPKSSGLWNAYATLDMARGEGVSGPEPIRVSDIASYCDIHGIADTNLRAVYCRIVVAMDCEYRRRLYGKT